LQYNNGGDQEKRSAQRVVKRLAESFSAHVDLGHAVRVTGEPHFRARHFRHPG
jgi:hypothetical protein